MLLIFIKKMVIVLNKKLNVYIFIYSESCEKFISFTTEQRYPNINRYCKITIKKSLLIILKNNFLFTDSGSGGVRPTRIFQEPISSSSSTASPQKRRNEDSNPSPIVKKPKINENIDYKKMEFQLMKKMEEIDDPVFKSLMNFFM